MKNDLNALCAEVFTIIHVMEHMENKDLFYVSRNLFRVVNSLRKQRELAFSVQRAFSTFKPQPDELKGIVVFISDCRKRIRFLKETILPDNMKMTPIHEYLVIVGSPDVSTDLYKRFKTRSEMYRVTTSEDKTDLNSYINDIFSTVEKAGKLHEYEDRLNEYIKLSDERDRKIEADKQERKRQTERRVAEDGMLVFQRRFNNVSFELRSDDRIRMGIECVRRRINQYGRNCFFILCCYTYAGKPLFRYVGNGLELYPYFYSGHVYMNEDEANADMEKLIGMHPDKVFEVVELSHIESA